jgi:hypothetical protein
MRLLSEGKDDLIYFSFCKKKSSKRKLRFFARSAKNPILFATFSLKRKSSGGAGVGAPDVLSS